MASVIHTDTLGAFTLTTHSLPDFYSRIRTLRFPISVAEVLELRDLINHSADTYEDPAAAPHNREFHESLEHAIRSFGIENQHHCDRLVRVLTMIRGMHVQHAIASRDAEQQLRQEQAEIRARRRNHQRMGGLSLLALAVSFAMWLPATDAGWPVKMAALASALLAFLYYRALPRLDRRLERLTGELNDVLRKRLDSLNWRTLIHKLALLLGYKKIQGIEVFAPESIEHGDARRRVHYARQGFSGSALAGGRSSATTRG
jgi:hypothetical protein